MGHGVRAPTGFKIFGDRTPSPKEGGSLAINFTRRYRSRLRWLILFGAGAAIISALTAGALATSHTRHRQEQAALLEAVADLRANQLAHWMDERMAQAHFAASGSIGTSLAAWLDKHDHAALDELNWRLARFRTASASQAILVLDTGGTVIAATDDHAQASAAMATTTAQAMATNKVTINVHAPASDGLGDHGHVDLVAPLALSGNPPRGALVMRLDYDGFVNPTLARWPLPSVTAGTVLLRRGGQPLRPGPNGIGALLPADVTHLESGTVDTHTAAGQAVLAVARPVANTDWLVVATIDRSEALAEAHEDALWILGCGGLLLLAWTISLHLVRQRQALRVQVAKLHEQADTIQALQLLQSIADNSQDAIYAKDTSGRFILFNCEAARICGKPASGVLGRFDREVFSEEEARQMQRSDLQVLQSEVPFRYELSLNTVDGRRTFTSIKSVLRGPMGEVTGVFGISRDITERLQLETAEREASLLIRAVGNSILDQMAVVDACGHVIETNEPWRNYGAEPQPPQCDALPRCELGADYLAALVGCLSPHAHAVREGVAAVLDGRRPLFEIEHNCIRADGERWFALKVTPLKVARGGAVIVHTDITELKRHRDHLEDLVAQRTHQLAETNAAFERNERFLRTLTDAIPVGLAYWDRDRCCKFANRQYRERFGIEQADVGVVTLEEVLGPELYARLQPVFDVVSEGHRYEYTSVVNGRDHLENHFQVTLIPDMHDASFEGIFVLASEITAIKRVEQALRNSNAELVAARDRAEAASRTKGAFLANMSHEIRTPINAIIGFTDLLRHDIADDVQAKRLDHVAEAAGDLLQLVNDILDLSKFESGKFTLEQVDFPLAGVTDHAVMLVAEQARLKGLQLTSCVATVPDMLCGDPTRLAQALANLLCNAVKFTERGNVELAVLPVPDAGSGILLRFEVRDTGIGIAPDKLDKLFAAFEQADSSTTRRFGGTGLGLAITRHLAGLMGGEAGVASQPGVGSTFWFTARFGAPSRDAVAPIAHAPGIGCSGTALQAAAGDAQAEQALRSSHASARVLVVEDNHFNQEVALAVLQRAGLAADVAANGEEAVRMAQQRRYDLVLMDLQMPVMDGYAAARALRQLPDYGSTPILALTANAFNETRSACLDAGMDDHIAKPVSPRRLYEALLRWLPQAAVPVPVPPKHDSGIADSLAGIEGLSAAAGLATTGGDEPAFEDMLRRFIARHADGLPGLDTSLVTGQRQRARLLVHSLKGAAAAIGAASLQKRAARLEMQLAQGGATQALRLMAFDLEHDLVQLVAALHDVVPGGPEPQPGPDSGSMARHELEEAVASLEVLLECGDFSAQRFHREIAPALRDAFGVEADLLAEAVRDRDDERALVILRALVTRRMADSVQTPEEA
jgi:two-component system, sensor histidine kinase and response regulator